MGEDVAHQNDEWKKPEQKVVYNNMHQLTNVHLWA